MMDQLIITLVLINIFTANGELHCFTCSNCPNADDLDYNLSQPCNFVSPPDTPPTSPSNTPPTSPSNTPPTSPSNTPPTSPSNTPPTSSPNTTPTSPPNTPPTGTPTTSTIIDTNVTTEYENEKTTEKQSIIPTRFQRILTQTLLEDTVKQSNYQCFRITRNVDDELEVARGCVLTGRTIHETCVRANNGVSPITCRICHFDDCNAARRDTTSSIIIMFTSIVSMTILR